MVTPFRQQVVVSTDMFVHTYVNVVCVLTKAMYYPVVTTHTAPNEVERELHHGAMHHLLLPLVN